MAKKKVKVKKGFRIVIILLLVVILGVFALDFFDISSHFIKSKKEKKQASLYYLKEYLDLKEKINRTCLDNIIEV